MNLSALLRLATATMSLAAALIAALSRPRTLQPAQPAQPAQPTAREVFGAITAATEDALNAYKLAGFPEEQAKAMMRRQMVAGLAAAPEPASSSGLATEQLDEDSILST